MRPYFKLLSGAAATFLGVLLVLNPAFAEEPAEAPAQEAAAEQAPAEEAAAEQAPAEAAPAEEAVTAETPPVEMEAPEREVPRGLEEIVITAEKREALLQDTPVAVTAFTAERMKDFNIRSGTDYTTLVPSMSYRVSPNRIYIRGIGRTDNALGLDPGVATYTDGVYTSETTVLFSSFFGSERMEILRGPQGTLYGRNTTGGAVNFISEKPSEEFNIQGRIRLGNYNTREYGLITTGPMPFTDRIRYHVLANDLNIDDEQKNYGGRDSGDADTRYYRVQVEADLTEDLTLWLLWDRLLQSDDGSAWADFSAYHQGNASQLHSSAQFGNPGLPPGVRDAHYVDLDTNYTIRLQDTYAVRGSLTWDLDTIRIKYLAGFQTYDWSQDGVDFDGTSVTDGEFINSFGLPGARPQPGINQAFNFVREDKQYYSHELQVNSTTDDPLQWLAGLYYYSEEIEQPWMVYYPYQTNIQLLCLPFPDGTPDWGCTNGVVPNVWTAGGTHPGLTYGQLGKLKSKAYAAYGELYYDFAERFKLTTGLRYSYDRKHGNEWQDTIIDPLFYGLDYGLGCCGILNSSKSARRNDDWNSLTGRAVLDVMLNDDSMAYFSVSQGYKAGGFRLGPVLNPVDADPYFDSEKLLAFEVGYKGTFMDRFRLNGAVFYYDYRDQQVLRAFFDESAGIPHQNVVNAKKTIMYGLELESEYRVTDDLLLSGNYSYNRARFRDFCCSLDESYPERGNQDLQGNQVPQTPEQKVSLAATYTLPLFTDLGRIDLTGRWSWVDETPYDIFNNAIAPSYSRLDYFLTWNDPEDRYTVIGYVKNATDEDNFSSYSESVRAAGNRFSGFANPPRTFGVELLFKFD